MRHHVSEASLCETAVQKELYIYNGSGAYCSRGSLKTISRWALLSFLSEKECRRIRCQFMYHSTCCFMKWTIVEASGPDLQFLSVSLPYTCQKHPRAYISLRYSVLVLHWAPEQSPTPGERTFGTTRTLFYGVSSALWRQGNNGCIAQWKNKTKQKPHKYKIIKKAKKNMLLVGNQS